MLVISEGVYYFIRAILCFGLLEMCFCVKQRRWRAVGISILIGIFHSFNIRTAGDQLVNVELATEILIIVLVSVFYIRAKLMKIVSITWLCCVTVQMLEFLLTVTLVPLKKDSPVVLYAERRVAFFILLFCFTDFCVFVFEKVEAKRKRDGNSLGNNSCGRCIVQYSYRFFSKSVFEAGRQLYTESMAITRNIYNPDCRCVRTVWVFAA